jgi:hypothetical protein
VKQRINIEAIYPPADATGEELLMLSSRDVARRRWPQRSGVRRRLERLGNRGSRKIRRSGSAWFLSSSEANPAFGTLAAGGMRWNA